MALFDNRPLSGARDIMLNNGIVGYFKNRWKIILGLLVLIGLLATAGVRAGGLPIIGSPLFLAALFIWYLPGVLFEWTGLFTFHEFGAIPKGVAGYIVMFLFYVALAVLLAAPCGRQKSKDINSKRR